MQFLEKRIEARDHHQDQTTFEEHKCAHDEHFHEYAESLSLGSNSQTPESDSQIDKRAVIGAAPIRFAVDFSMIDRVDPLACSTVGAIVQIKSGSRYFILLSKIQEH